MNMNSLLKTIVDLINLIPDGIKRNCVKNKMKQEKINYMNK